MRLLHSYDVHQLPLLCCWNTILLFRLYLLLSLCALFTGSCKNSSSTPVTTEQTSTDTKSANLHVSFLPNGRMGTYEIVEAELHPGNYHWKGYVNETCSFAHIPPGIYSFHAYSGAMTSPSIVLTLQSGEMRDFIVGFMLTGGNKPPLVPYNPYPADGSTIDVGDSSLHFTWQCNDPEGSPLSYVVMVSAFADFHHYIVYSPDLKIKEYTAATLPSASNLYWCVKAWDEQGAMTVSPVWTLHLPRHEPALLFHVPCNGSVADVSPEHHNTAGYNIGYVNDRYEKNERAIYIDSLLSSRLEVAWFPSLPFHPGEDFSLSFWIKTAGSPMNYSPSLAFMGCFTPSNISKPAQGWQLRLAGSYTLNIACGNVSATTELTMKGSIDDNEWKHIVVLSHALENRNEIYVNGSLVYNGVAPFSALLTLPEVPFIIGNNTSQKSNCLAAAYDDIRLYRGIISKEQILALAKE